jgi:thioredoxin-related protein
MMKFFGSLAVWFCLVFCAVAQTVPALPRAVDLQKDAQEASTRRVPLVLYFSLEGCHFCRGVMREVLGPMQQDPGWQRSAVYRQIEIDEDRPLIDFAGNKTTHRAFAGKRLAPTVAVVDAKGQAFDAPIVGVANWDFYAYYVEEQIKKAYQKLNP